MEAEQNTLQQQVMDRAMKDEAFRQMLLSNPKETLERELGLALPTGVNIQVHENTSTVLHLVLPIQEQTGVPQDLSDAELEQVVGGQGSQDRDQIALAFGDTDHNAVLTLTRYYGAGERGNSHDLLLIHGRTDIP